MRIRTIIVTGGAGFIGSNFIFYMKRKHPDYRLICLDKLTYAGNLVTLQPLMEEADFRFYKADICDRDAVYKVFEEEHPDVVVNFAAESHVDRSIESPEIFLDTNIKGTAVLMDACIKYQVGRFHQISTDEVYGDLPLDRPELLFTEETPLCTSSPYSSSKAAADLPTTLRRLSMDIRLVAREKQLESWALIIQECKNGGLKTKDWLAQRAPE